ncbi:hypothetical protein LPB79_13260 [Rhizobium sp. T136]|uniref:hypothetical protein n=1 Tax=Rhizobium sp. T136 TaxID=555319 RepID=UPI001E30FAE0|nr:hypothetical protein [Rhizobium sp. T136]UFS83216.1 hypothetical protein LPB79_13260 [Rhizobium sp. T136]
MYSAPSGTLATTLTTIKSPEYNAFVNDLVSDANAARPVVAGGTGATSVAGAQTSLSVVGFNSQTLTAAQQAQARANVSAALFGHLYGLTLSNNATDATNDIDIAAGEAASTEASPVLMVLASALTKRLDAAWAVGSGNGGLDTGSIANTTYHVWLIQRSDTGVVDALFSASATAPTMPTNYDRKRRIGSIIRKSAAIIAFSQRGDQFLFSTVQEDISQANPGVVALTPTLTVPSGIVVEAMLHTRAINAANLVTFSVYFSSLSQTSESVAASKIHLIAQAGSNYARETVQDVSIRTDTSSRIRAIASASDANCTLIIGTYGWLDERGRV